MTSDTDLDLIFKNAAGKKVVLNIEEPKSGVTKAEIDAAMQVIVDSNIFATTGGDIVEAVGGRLAELVFAGTHGKQTGRPHGRDRGAELQHRRHARRCCQKVEKRERRANDCVPFGKNAYIERCERFLLGASGMNTKGCIQKAEEMGNATLVTYGEILKFI